MKKQYVSVDIAKFILSIFIAIIHCDPFKYVSTNLSDTIDIVCQLAVPMFFMFSAYFLYSKMDRASAGGHLFAYAKRMGIMYLVWFVIMLPMTYALQFGGRNLLSYRTLRMFLFGSTFRGSWYLTASVTAAFIIYFMCKRMRTEWVIVVCMHIYVLCIMSSIFGKVFEDFILMQILKNVFGKITQTFIVALLYYALGKWLAENAQKERGLKCYCTPGISLLAMACFAMLLVEWNYSIDMGWNSGLQASAFMPITALLVTIFVLNTEVKSPILIKIAPWLRVASSITYFVHFIVLYILRNVLNVKWHFINRFIVIMTVCWSVATIVYLLETKEKVKFLKYIH